MYGYYTNELSKGSNLNIILTCDYCQIEYTSSIKRRNKNNNIVDKDACFKCRYKKRDDIGLKKYGVANPFERKEIKDKIKNKNLIKYGVNSFTETEEFKQKTKRTNLKKYGHENAMSNTDIQDRQKQAIIDKYGVDNISKVDSVQKQKQLTCETKYGTKQFLQSKYAREKIASTNVQKYGSPNVFANEDIKEKIVSTNIKNLGVQYPMQNEAVKEKSVKTNLNKYGVSNPACLPEIKSKIKQSNIDRYGVEFPTQNQDIKNKIRSTAIKNGTIKTFSGKTMKELSEEFKQAYSTFAFRVRKYGIDIALITQSSINSLESAIKLILDSNNIDYIHHGHVNGRYTDFLLEDNKLVIETDGLYWHSDQIIKDKNYHSIKQEVYSKAGYRSLFFRENEINNQISIVKSIILNACNKSSKIYARKCTVQMVDKTIGKRFFEDNHLMGKGAGYIYGLYHDKDLVSCIQIKRVKDNNYEISRFCNSLNTSVIGGFSKLLKFAENNLTIKSLTTFIDCRYGFGDYLTQFGFIKQNKYLSFKWVGDRKVFNRMKYRGNSGYEHGLAKIYDCGQLKYVKLYD